MKFNKKYTIYLSIIILISLLLKIYTTDFSIPVNSDNLVYVINAISYKNGDFSQLPDRSSGWSLFLYPFFNLVNSNNFFDYSNLARILSIGISCISIPAVYLLGRSFFNEKYSLVAASLFAFEPHLNYNSGFGLSEPLYNLAIILMFYFILNKNTKYVIPSLFMAGIVWWTRINGLLMFVVISIVYFVTFRNSNNLLKNYGLGILVLLIIISPMLIQKYIQYDDPLYYLYSDNLFAGNLEKTLSVNARNSSSSAFDYIDKNSSMSFIDNFIIPGIYNMFSTLIRISLPYLFILIPFGILFSFRTSEQNSNNIKSLWIFIIISLSVTLITFFVVNERRFLFYLFPFLCIIGTITIQKVTEHGLNVFSFSTKQKNLFLVLVIGLIVILSGLFTILQYGKPDTTLENEKMEFANYLINNLHGNLLDETGIALDYVMYIQIIDSPAGFQNYKINSHTLLKNESLQTIRLYAESMDELISVGESYNLKYVISNENSGFFHPYVDYVYNHEDDYPYLHKIFDSNENEFKKLKVKVFEIDYNKFYQND